MIGLSEKAARIAQSEIRVMSIECERVRGVNLAQGICDTEVPEPVRRGAREAIERGQNQYTRLDGITTLRQAIAQKMQRYNGIAADAERGIVVTAGSTGGFLASCLAILNRGDEVVLFEPYYGYHLHTLDVLGVTPVFVTLHAPDWRFSKEDLERAVTPRTKAIVVNTPANPSGKVFSREELGWIADIAQSRDIFVITDEIYEYFLYDGKQHISPATLPGMAERTITISGFSKTFSITGWRVGYVVCSPRWANAIGYYSDLAYICAPSPFQHAVAAGLNELTDDFYQSLNAEYAVKRTLLCDALRDAGLTPSVPDGAYYVLAEASALPGTTSKQRAMYLLETTGVAAVPGAAFYHPISNDGKTGGEELLRFCFAKTDSELRNGCERLQRLASVSAAMSSAPVRS